MGKRRWLGNIAALLVFALAACKLPAQGPAAVDSGRPAAVSPKPAAGDPKPDSPNAVDPSSEQAFTASTALVFRKYSDRVHVAVLEPLTLKLEVVGTDKHDLRVSLDRMWAVCQSDHAGCGSAMDDFVAKVVQTVTTPEQPVTPDQVIAVLRPRSYFDVMGGPSAPNVLAEPFVDDLYLVYVVDLPQSVRSLVPADLEWLKLTRADLAPLARANLATRLEPIGDTLRTAKPGNVAVLRAGNPLESSRLLLLDEWRTLSSRVGQSIVVAAPAADTVILAIGARHEQLPKLREMVAAAYADAQRPCRKRSSSGREHIGH
jgi:hypothetical protein